MSQPDQKNAVPVKGEGGQKRSNPRRRKRRPRPESAENSQKQPNQQANKPREERPDRNQRIQKKERSQRSRRQRRDVAPVPETYEDVARDNTRLEKEIRLDIDGFSQITLDL